jgi:hypothetical protein
VLIVRHILEHAYQLRSFSDALKRLVRPGGYVVFEVPDCRPALTCKDYSMPWEEHIAYFTPETFRQTLSLLGFSELRYECYTYSNENSLVAIVRPESTLQPNLLSSEVLDEQKGLGENYATAFGPYRSLINGLLGEYHTKRGRIAVFGAGHLSCFWINVLGIKRWIEFVVDDDANKRELLMPGSRLPIRSSSALTTEEVGLCLLSLNSESEARVVAKYQQFRENGGTFATIFPGKPSSVEAVLFRALKDYVTA